jgi:hypothetical protein
LPVVLLYPLTGYVWSLSLKPKCHRIARYFYLAEPIGKAELITIALHPSHLGCNLGPKILNRQCAFAVVARSTRRVQVVNMVEPFNLFRRLHPAPEYWFDVVYLHCLLADLTATVGAPTAVFLMYCFSHLLPRLR